MDLSNLKKRIQSSATFSAVRDYILSGKYYEIYGAMPIGSAFIADYIANNLKRTVLWIPRKDPYESYLELEAITGENTYFFPEWDIDPYEHRFPDPGIVAQRINVLHKLSLERSSIVVASPKSLLFPTISPDVLREKTIDISIGEKIDPDSVLEKLIAVGYRREELVEFIGAVSRRGDILDVFSPTHEDPIRIEFFGDEVESIRTFSAENQRSREHLKETSIVPPAEWLKHFWSLKEIDAESLKKELLPNYRARFNSEKAEDLLARMIFDKHFPGEIWFSPAFAPSSGWFIDHLPENSIIICEEPEEVFDTAREILSIAEEHHFDLTREGELHLSPSELFLDEENFERNLTKHNFIPVRQFETSKDSIDLGFRPIPARFDGPVAFRRAIEDFKEKELETQIICTNPYQLDRLKEIVPQEESVRSFSGEIFDSFIHIPSKSAVISSTAIFGKKKGIPQRRIYREGSIYALPTGLAPGDYIVHTDHGIGRFLGIESIESSGFVSECLIIKYADDEKLYVPVEDFHLVQKYIGGEHVSLAKLGGTAWAKAKERARKGIMAIAGELVQIYALRKVSKGFQFPPEDELSFKLAESFPFAETRDQLKTIADVIDDMEKPVPMDRLLVGDVGFGKTEIAIRSAFKCVRGGKQVAVLVPTTVLADQHFRTFSQRLSGLPVAVEMLSRFRTKKQQKLALDKLATGEIDIIIGTHRLLSKDVFFKDLGLLIVDEEQRFGVKQKEKIKRFRSKIDVLTMTATPIPRTLYMSLAGVRDISTIDTPPASRLPIYTRMVPFSEKVIVEAIRREIERGGQVYFLHNRVGSIEAMARWLRGLVPEANFAVAHGQLPEKELSSIVMDFLAGKFDVLVTTTIIESGTDIPNVNTILINRADKFGVSQLYQLRGRVGRSDIQAYCYLIAPPYRNISIKAKKRLRAILEHSDLGSGFALAMRDMEIRGAGNLLGAQQHGFVEEVGLDLYTKMLSDAVAELRKEKPPYFVPISTQVDFPLIIPRDYIPSADMRIEFYQRLYMSNEESKLNAIKEEMLDRFGTPPQEVITLISFLRMRLSASKIRIPLSEVILRKGKATFLFKRDWQPRLAEIDRAISPLKLQVDFRRNPFELRFSLSGEPANDLLIVKNIADRLLQIEDAQMEFSEKNN